MRFGRMRIIHLINKPQIEKKLEISYNNLLLHTSVLFLFLAPIAHSAAESDAVTASSHGRPPVAFAQSTSDGPTAIIPDTLEIGDTVVADMGRLFSDPDGDPLTYSVQSSAPGAVEVVSLSANTLTLLAAGRGPATITVKASDPGGRSASLSFRIRVFGAVPGLTNGLPRRPFADRTSSEFWGGTLRLGLNPDVFPVIVMDREDRRGVLVAASRLGEGRVIAFSGQDFLSSREQHTLLGHASGDRLLANAVRWGRERPLNADSCRSRQRANSRRT